MNHPHSAEPAPTVLSAGLGEAEAIEVAELVARAAQVDGASALNEQAALTLRDGGGQVLHLLGHDGRGELVGYAQLAGGGGGAAAEAGAELHAECVVDPEHRRAGWGYALLARLLTEADGAPVLVWSHGDHPAAPMLASRLGFDRVRELWQLRRSLGPRAPALPPVRLPAGVRVRTFVVGEDEPAWLHVNARAFAGHPEQGAIDGDDLARRVAGDWFDADGFFLADRVHGDERRLVGFHWTKMEPGADGLVGEVYVVGVDPDEQGSGLGSALTLTGLHHLADRGAAAVRLYVEADNAAALRVYERLGFARVGTDVQYRHPGRAFTPGSPLLDAT